MVKVSAIIPTYNYAKFLGEAIESVLDQTFTDFELIVVDDGSTDNTREIVSKYRDPRIRYIYQENRGVSVAQNTGIKAAGGEYVAILGADDIWLPENLDMKVKILSDSPEAAFVCSDAYIFDDKSGVSLGRFWRDDPVHVFVDPRRAATEPLKELLSRGTFIPPQATVIRRSVFSEVGYFDEDLCTFEDWDLFVRVLLRYPIRVIDMPLVKLRRHGENLGGNDGKMLLGHVTALLKAIRSYSLPKTERELVKKRLSGLLPQLLRDGHQAMMSGRIDFGRKLLTAYVRSNPWQLRPYVYLTLSLLGNWGVLAIKNFKKLLEKYFPQNQPSGNMQANSMETGYLNDENIGVEWSGPMPKVSVIIPAYNYGQYIGEAIQSILDQTYTNFELIVVDDGSTDNTREVVKSFQDPRITYIYQENHGVASAQNTGIEASRGEYIALLGADDLYLPENLEIKVKLLDSRPDIGLVCSDIYHFDNLTGASLGRLWYDISTHYRFDPVKAADQPLKHIISWGCFIWPQSVVIRRQVFTEVGDFDESLTTCEDWDLFIRIVHRFPISVIDKPLAKIRRHNVSLMANEAKMYHGEVATLNKLLRSGKLSRNLVKLAKTKLAPMYLSHGRQAIRGDDIADGREALLNYIKIKPWTFKAYVLLALSILGTKRVVSIRCFKKRLGQLLDRYHTHENTQSITG